MNNSNNVRDSTVNRPTSTSLGSNIIGVNEIVNESSTRILDGRRGTDVRHATTSATMTITEIPTSRNDENEILRLTLRPRNTVRWDENVEDNEGMGRKSSKRCCIFHKQRDFGESSTDSSAAEEDNSSDGDNSEDDGSGIGNNNNKPKAKSATNPRRKIARPKSKKIPDFQRFHA